MTRKSRSHAIILIHRTWAIETALFFFYVCAFLALLSRIYQQNSKVVFVYDEAVKVIWHEWAYVQTVPLTSKVEQNQRGILAFYHLTVLG